MSDDVKLDPEWQREKVAKQAAAREPPPKPPRRFLGALIGLVLVMVTGVVIYVIATRAPAKSKLDSLPSAKVRIEVRGMPVMAIRKDGVKVGKTPVSLLVPNSKTPITLEAQWIDTLYAPNGAKKETSKRKVTTIVPDHDQTVDFNRRGAEVVE